LACGLAIGIYFRK